MEKLVKRYRELYKRVNYLKRLENTVEMDHLHTHTHTYIHTMFVVMLRKYQ